MWRRVPAPRKCSAWGRLSVRNISYTRVVCKEENLQQAYADLVRYFTYTRDLEYARKLHGKIVERGFGKDRYLLNLITEMYGKCGSFGEARQVFDALGAACRDQMSWSAIISASSETGRYEQGIEYYRGMLWEGMLPDAQLLSTVISCVETLPEARKMHGQLVSSGYDADQTLMTGVLNMYRRCDRLDLAHQVFESVENKSLFFWTSMLSAYSHTPGYALEGLKIFWSMELQGIRPDRVTFISWIAASSSLGCACYARSVDERVAAHGLEKDVVIASALLHMHGRCGNLEQARRVFNSMPEMNTITWNSIIAAYSFYGRGGEAITMYRSMDNHGFPPDHVTFASVLDACADLTALELGKAVHSRVVAVGLDSDLVIVSALLNLYGRCGKTGLGREVFDASWKNVSCWNAMITAYAQNVELEAAMRVFVDMCHQGVEPDDITFITLIAACGHARKMESGRDMFRLFQADLFQQPTVEHYGCMADMLGRNSKLSDAEELLDNMPFYPDLLAWTAILRGCKSSKDQSRGTRLAKAALDSYPLNSGPYVLLSQMSSEIENLDKDSPGNKRSKNDAPHAPILDFLELPTVRPCACAV